MSSQQEEEDRAVEVFKLKKLLKQLDAARGNGTSMISLIIPPKDQISRVNRMLSDEMGTATNIKSRVNRLSVLAAITSVQQRLKLYNKVRLCGGRRGAGSDREAGHEARRRGGSRAADRPPASRLGKELTHHHHHYHLRCPTPASCSTAAPC